MCRILALSVCLLGCDGQPAKARPGSPGNPVKICKQVGDVCVLDDARLGVCNQHDKTLTCMSQH